MATNGNAIAAVILGGFAVVGIAVVANEIDKDKHRRLSRSRRLEDIEGFARSGFLEAARVIGVEAPPLIADASVPNAQSDGYTVKYNPLFFGGLYDRHCTGEVCRRVVSIAIMAHELSHHIHGDRFSDTDRLPLELRADRLAGWVLGKLGTPPDDMAKVIADFPKFATLTHPDRESRMASMLIGWQEGINNLGFGAIAAYEFEARMRAIAKQAIVLLGRA